MLQSQSSHPKILLEHGLLRTQLFLAKSQHFVSIYHTRMRIRFFVEVRDAIGGTLYLDKCPTVSSALALSSAVNCFSAPVIPCLRLAISFCTTTSTFFPFVKFVMSFTRRKSKSSPSLSGAPYAGQPPAPAPQHAPHHQPLCADL